MIVTRMRDSAFKQSLKVSEPGAEITMDGASSSLNNNTQIPAVFLTGGIGITRRRSIFLQGAHDKLPHKIFVFDSNRRPEDAPFLEELTKIQTQNPNCNLVVTMTEAQESTREWRGETGYVSREMLMKHIDDLTLPIYYITEKRELRGATLRDPNALLT